MSSLSRIEQKLKKDGYKLTGQRKLIIEVFEDAPGHYTAQEVYQRVKEKSTAIDFSTVYRNLELLTKLGIIKKLNISSGVCHYEITGSGHHHHAICMGCGEMKELDICPYESMKASKLYESGFKAVDHKFEIYGYCSKCSS